MKNEKRSNLIDEFATDPVLQSCLRKNIHLTERTFERLFLKEIGVTPKNFARIIQFQNSKSQMSGPDISDTMDVIYRYFSNHLIGIIAIEL